MSPEGPPSKPLDTDIVVEHPLISLDQALDAYQRGDTETFQKWYLQRKKEADQDPKSVKRFWLSADLLRIQYAAGEMDKALETVNGLHEGLQQELIELDRAGSAASKRPDKDAYSRELRKLLQQVVFFRNKLRNQ